MRFLLAAVLSGTMILSSDSVAFAQKKGKGGGKGNSGWNQVWNNGGIPRGYYYGGYPGGIYGPGAYSGNYWYPGVGRSVGSPLGFNYPWGYSRYDYGLGDPYYTGSYSYGPVVTSSPVVTSAPASPSYETIAAPTPAVDPNAANVEVRLPEKATLWIDGQPTKMTGAVRHFVSPPLEKDKTFTYEIRAKWTDAAGKEVERTKKVEVKAGAWIGVDFNRVS